MPTSRHPSNRASWDTPQEIESPRALLRSHKCGAYLRAKHSASPTLQLFPLIGRPDLRRVPLPDQVTPRWEVRNGLPPRRRIPKQSNRLAGQRSGLARWASCQLATLPPGWLWDQLGLHRASERRPRPPDRGQPQWRNCNRDGAQTELAVHLSSISSQ
jgi:hypothetical protein